MRFLACALLVITTSYAAATEVVQDTCEPGRGFKYYCNSCTCAENGMVASSMCTMIYCGQAKWTKNGLFRGADEAAIESSISETPEAKKSCEPGNRFMYYCNTCVCGEDGIIDEAACTRISCTPDKWYKNGTLKHHPEIVSESLSRETRDVDDEYCEPGKRFMNYCNTCFCGSDGLAARAACTDMYCSPEEWNRDGTLKALDETPISLGLRKKREENQEGCEPGTRFKDYCNSCFCGPDGRAMCTRMFCNPDDWNKDGSSKHPERIVVNPLLSKKRQIEEKCEPGHKFMDYCNTCFCGPDGRAMCTKMFCNPDDWNKDGSSKHPERIVVNPLLSEKRQGEEKCEPGNKFMDYCNTCFCGPDGRAMCTRMFCDSNEWNKNGTRKHPKEISAVLRGKRQSQERCEPGSSFMNYCNTCFCGNPDGIAAYAGCTMMYCTPGVWNRDGSIKNTSAVDAKTFLRAKRDVEKRCQPGESFMNYCNTCFCGSDSRPMCTKMYCNPEVWNKDGSLKRPYEIAVNASSRKQREVEEQCEPGTHYNDYCNTCYCGSPDGIASRASCSRMYCAPGVWNKDGTLKISTGIEVSNPSLTAGDQVVERCQVGTSFRNYCNTCYCGNPDGIAAYATCSMAYCAPGVWNRDGTLKISTGIEESSPPLSETNHDEPLLRATRDVEERCEPGTRFMNYCNTCLCGPSGFPRCTRMLCNPEEWNKDGTLKISTGIEVSSPSLSETNQDEPLLRATRDVEERCEPGTRFMHYCNTCLCGPNGLPRCTRMLCNPEEWNKDGTVKISTGIEVSSPSLSETNQDEPLMRVTRDVEERCEPGTRFMNYCNTCLCGPSGFPRCTRMFCNPEEWNKDGTVKISTGIEVSSPSLSETNQNEPLMRVTRDVEERCEPGTRFMNYCNTCLCGPSGFPRCTRMFCNPEEWNKDGTVKISTGIEVSSPSLSETNQNEPLMRVTRDVEERCEPGKRFMDYCNTCICGNNGKPRCTRMLCDPEEWNKDGSRKHPNGNGLIELLSGATRQVQQSCEPGKLFMDECNTCTCAEDGTFAICTKMGCDSLVPGNKGASKIAAANLPLMRVQRSSEFLCQPGRAYQDNCNRCVCGRDGKNAACTQMFCPSRQTASAPRVCEPGNLFKIDCNQCSCSKDGLKIACTLMDCPSPSE